jgi:hypothetical protein
MHRPHFRILAAGQVPLGSGGHHSHDTNLALADLVADVTQGKPHTPRLAADHDRGYRGSPSSAEVVLVIAAPGRITGVTRPPHGLLKFLGLDFGDSGFFGCFLHRLPNFMSASSKRRSEGNDFRRNLVRE